MKGLRYLIICPVVLLLASVTMGIHNYQAAKEAMRQDLTRALRQFVMDESQQRLLTHSMATLHEDMVLTLNDPDQYFCAQLTIPSLKDTSHVALCLMERNREEAFREEAQVCSDTLLWHSASADAAGVFIALKAYANPTFCSILSHSSQRLPLAGALICLLMLSAPHTDAGTTDGDVRFCSPSHPHQGNHLRGIVAQERPSRRHPLHVYLSYESQFETTVRHGHHQQERQRISTYQESATD